MVQVSEMQFRATGWGQISHNPIQARRWTEYAASKGDVSAINALRNLRTQFDRKRVLLDASNKKRLTSHEFPEVEAPPKVAQLRSGFPVAPGMPVPQDQQIGVRRVTVSAATAKAAEGAAAALSPSGEVDPMLLAAVEQALARLETKPAAPAQKPAVPASPYMAPLSMDEVAREFPELVRQHGMRNLEGKTRMQLIDMKALLHNKDD
jgi:hypothetical protein